MDYSEAKIKKGLNIVNRFSLLRSTVLGLRYCDAQDDEFRNANRFLRGRRLLCAGNVRVAGRRMCAFNRAHATYCGVVAVAMT